METPSQESPDVIVEDIPNTSNENLPPVKDESAVEIATDPTLVEKSTDVNSSAEAAAVVKAGAPKDFSYLDDKILQVIAQSKNAPDGEHLILDFGESLFLLNRALGGNVHSINKITADDQHFPLVSTFVWDKAAIPDSMWTMATVYTNLDPTLRLDDTFDPSVSTGAGVPISKKSQKRRDKMARRAGKMRIKNKHIDHAKFGKVVVDPDTGFPQYPLHIYIDKLTLGILKNCLLVPYVEEKYICTVPSRRRILGFFIKPFKPFKARNMNDPAYVEWMKIRNQINQYCKQSGEAIRSLHVMKLQADIHKEEKQGLTGPLHIGDLYKPLIEFDTMQSHVSAIVIEDELFGKSPEVIAAEEEEARRKKLYEPTHQEAEDDMYAAMGFLNLQLIYLQRILTKKGFDQFMAATAQYTTPHRTTKNLAGIVTDSSIMHDKEVVALASEYGSNLREFIFQRNMVKLEFKDGQPMLCQLNTEEQQGEMESRKKELSENLQAYKNKLQSMQPSIQENAIDKLAKLVYCSKADSDVRMISDLVKTDQSKIPGLVEASLQSCIEDLRKANLLLEQAPQTTSSS